MNTGKSSRSAARALCAAALGMGALLLVQDAAAIIGMPLTPMSYAGVARRTTRRAVVAGAAVGTAAAATTAATVTALPPGCVPTGSVYGCGGTYYTPAYSGTNVVYVTTPPP